MKAKLSLPERPSALFLLAVVDLLVVLLIFFTFIPVVAQQAGVVMDYVELESRAPNIDQAKKASVMVTGGPPVKIFLGGSEVSLAELEAELTGLREDAGIEWVYVLPDKQANWGLVMSEVVSAINAAGLKAIGGGTLPVEEGSE